MNKEKVYKLDESGFILKYDEILSDEQVVKELNDLNHHRLRHRKEKNDWEDIAMLCFDVIDGYRSYNELKRRGYFE